jgi:predicted dehydrogenase
MKKNRRDFLKMTGIAGLSIAGERVLKSYASDTMNLDKPNWAQMIKNYEQEHIQQFNMSGYAAPAMDIVRVGIIGIGKRGPTYINTMGRVEGAEIKAVCDLRSENAEEAKKMAGKLGHQPVIYSGDKDIWRKLCERDDIDLVIVTTPWTMHAEMGVYAMNQGKHTAIAVPAAATIEECWQLVKTSEETKKHCMMLENCCYHNFQMLTLNMAREGFFGEIVHGEGAYNSSKMSNNFSKTMYWDMWWLRQYASRKGNIYPTHGLGPISQIMDINRGDKFDFLVSVESKDFMMGTRAAELAATDSFFEEFTNKDYRGNMNITIIKTTQGRTIMLQHDATSPSPETYIHGIYGTHGAALKYPYPPRISTGNHKWVSPEEFEAINKKYSPEIIKVMEVIANKIGGHEGSDTYKCWRLIDCLRNGFPLDIDVYDSVTWSCVLPLSSWSVYNHSNSIQVPDFTAGSWKSNERNMDVELKHHGNTMMR